MLQWIGIISSAISVLAAASLVARHALSRYRLSSRRRFLADREQYETLRMSLNERAVGWYGPNLQLIDRTRQITCPGWIPARPISIKDVTVSDDANAKSEAELLGSLSPSLSVGLPLQMSGVRRFSSRHEAVEALSRPALWQNRMCYRITGLNISGESASLTVGPTHFFSGFDVSESLAVELLRAKSSASRPELPLRQAIGRPVDLGRNPVHAGVCTLTIVRGTDGVPRFFLHERSRSAVADGLGQRHVVPAGVFQPSTDHRAAWGADRDVWKNVVREACEEFLPGLDELDSTSAPLDLRTVEPYASLMRLLSRGTIKCYFLGLSVDPVQLQPEIMTVIIFHERTFRRLFGATFSSPRVENREGRIIGSHISGTTKSGCRLVGFEFSENGVEEALSGPLVSGAAGCLSLAWSARQFLAA